MKHRWLSIHPSIHTPFSPVQGQRGLLERVPALFWAKGSGGPLAASQYYYFFSLFRFKKQKAWHSVHWRKAGALRQTEKGKQILEQWSQMSWTELDDHLKRASRLLQGKTEEICQDEGQSVTTTSNGINQKCVENVWDSKKQNAHFKLYFGNRNNLLYNIVFFFFGRKFWWEAAGMGWQVYHCVASPLALTTPCKHLGTGETSCCSSKCLNERKHPPPFFFLAKRSETSSQLIQRPQRETVQLLKNTSWPFCIMGL